MTRPPGDEGRGSAKEQTAPVAEADDNNVGEGVEHLQRAGQELIGAARAFLNAAEETLADPGAVRELMEGASALLSLAKMAAANSGSSGSATGDTSGAGQASNGNGNGSVPSGVEPIEVD